MLAVRPAARGLGIVTPFDDRVLVDVHVAPRDAGKATPGDMVSVEVLRWPTATRGPVGRAVEVLGRHGSVVMRHRHAADAPRLHGKPLWRPDPRGNLRDIRPAQEQADLERYALAARGDDRDRAAAPRRTAGRAQRDSLGDIPPDGPRWEVVA
jgi:hypothetical protein